MIASNIVNFVNGWKKEIPIEAVYEIRLLKYRQAQIERKLNLLDGEGGTPLVFALIKPIEKK